MVRGPIDKPETSTVGPQQRGHLGEAMALGVVKRRATPPIAAIWIGAELEQQRRQFQVALGCTDVQSRAPVVVLKLEQGLVR